MHNYFCAFCLWALLILQRDQLAAGVICELVLKTKHMAHNATSLYSHISSLGKLKTELIGVLNEVKGLPYEIIHQNQRAFIQLTRAMNFRVQAIERCSVSFFNEISDIFINRRTSAAMDHIFHCLLTATIQEVFDTNNFSISLNDLIECARYSKLVLFSYDFVETIKRSWIESLSNGLLFYRKLLEKVQLVISYLALEPSNTCQNALQRLTSGCPQASAPMSSAHSNTVGIRQSENNICTNFCINVLRGCLAPPLLFLPTQSADGDISSPWEVMLSPPTSHPPGQSDLIQSTMQSLLSSLDATKLVELVISQLDGVKANLPTLNDKLKLFCEEISTFGLPETETGNLHEQNPLLEQSNDQHDPHDLLRSKLQLVAKVKRLTTTLVRIAGELRNSQGFVEAVENKYCRQTASSFINEFEQQCWNGESFARYTKSVPPFTVHGQRTNPEVPISTSDLQIYPQTISTAPTQKPRAPVVGDNEEDLDPEDSNLMWHEEIEGSGIVPVIDDLGFLPELQKPPNTEQEEKPDPDLSISTLPELYGGCAVDDEDCEVDFKPSEDGLPSLDERSQQQLRIPNVSGEAATGSLQPHSSVHNQPSSSSADIDGWKNSTTSTTTQSNVTGSGHFLLVSTNWLSRCLICVTPTITISLMRSIFT